ncbi:winged helix-turn-helix transcriptional regulator [Streptosporangium sp. NPDC002721]|uniref:winged helix-turn-helix transcriptional regulator n=1 Tax=Streptosporangium sp. NPDC002721 TaxID=3366188 RepID=UPI00368FC784
MATDRKARVGAPCPIGRAVDAVGERWTLLILRNATLGTTRFEDFRSELGIADNILSARLGRLVERGLLTRVPYRDGGRTRDEYRLTAAGADLLPVLHALAAWGQEHTVPDEPAEPMRVVHRTCGQVTTPGGRCDHCGRPVLREEEAWVRPWRSSEPTPLASPVT